jgi:hypothetical protein
MTYTQANPITEEDFDAMLEDEIYIDNAAVFTIDYDANQLVVYFDGVRNAVMELKDDNETALCDTVLRDPNFWANFLGTFSAALKKTGN